MIQISAEPLGAFKAKYIDAFHCVSIDHSTPSCWPIFSLSSLPFFTGLAQFVDTEGRIDKFQKRFGAVRRVGKPKVG